MATGITLLRLECARLGTDGLTIGADSTFFRGLLQSHKLPGVTSLNLAFGQIFQLDRPQRHATKLFHRMLHGEKFAAEQIATRA